jgi:hypothetical protein
MPLLFACFHETVVSRGLSLSLIFCIERGQKTEHLLSKHSSMTNSFGLLCQRQAEETVHLDSIGSLLFLLFWLRILSTFSGPAACYRRVILVQLTTISRRFHFLKIKSPHEKYEKESF